MIRQILKSAAVSFVILHFIAFSFVVRLMVPAGLRRRTLALDLVRRHAIVALKLMGIELRIEGAFKAENTYYICANHMSWLDALLVPALKPVSFITSYEIKEMPVLGLLVDLGGCLYTERRNKENIHKEIGAIAQALQEGTSIVIFPEATSTNGEQVLPFKRSLLAAAVEAKTPLLPMVIQYEDLEGIPVTKQNRDALCWYGDMSFVPHFFKLMKYKKIGIRIKIFPEIPVEENSTRDSLVDAIYPVIAKNYKPIT